MTDHRVLSLTLPESDFSSLAHTESKYLIDPTYDSTRTILADAKIQGSPFHTLIIGGAHSWAYAPEIMQALSSHKGVPATILRQGLGVPEEAYTQAASMGVQILRVPNAERYNNGVAQFLLDASGVLQDDNTSPVVVLIGYGTLNKLVMKKLKQELPNADIRVLTRTSRQERMDAVQETAEGIRFYRDSPTALGGATHVFIAAQEQKNYGYITNISDYFGEQGQLLLAKDAKVASVSVRPITPEALLALAKAGISVHIDGVSAENAALNNELTALGAQEESALLKNVQFSSKAMDGDGCRADLKQATVHVLRRLEGAAPRSPDLIIPTPDIKPLQGREVAVVGGGIGGITAAYCLDKAGAKVTLYDANPQIPYTAALPAEERYGTTARGGPNGARHCSATEAGSRTKSEYLLPDATGREKEVVKMASPSSEQTLEDLEQVEATALNVAGIEAWRIILRNLDNAGLIDTLPLRLVGRETYSAVRGQQLSTGTLRQTLTAQELCERYPSLQRLVQEGNVSHGLLVEGFALCTHAVIQAMLERLSSETVQWGRVVSRLKNNTSGVIVSLKDGEEKHFDNVCVSAGNVAGLPVITEKNDIAVSGVWAEGTGDLPYPVLKLHSDVTASLTGDPIAARRMGVINATQVANECSAISGGFCLTLGQDRVDFYHPAAHSLIHALKIIYTTLTDTQYKRGTTYCVRAFDKNPPGLQQDGSILIVGGLGAGGTVRASVIAMQVVERWSTR